MRTGTVYTETVVHIDVPYQVVIVTLDHESRVTGRVTGDRLVIDDRVTETERIDGVPYFRKTS